MVSLAQHLLVAREGKLWRECDAPAESVEIKPFASPRLALSSIRWKEEHL